MKFCLIFFLFTLLINQKGLCQDMAVKSSQPLGKYKLIFTSFEKSEKGIKWTKYILTKRKFSVYDNPFSNQNFREHLHTLHKFNSKHFLEKFSQLRLDTLNHLFRNSCVPFESGREFLIQFMHAGKYHEIKLQNYYNEEVEELVRMINQNFPRVFHITYLPPGTIQDCLTN